MYGGFLYVDILGELPGYFLGTLESGVTTDAWRFGSYHYYFHI
jgi:hypothetical protein